MYWFREESRTFSLCRCYKNNSCSILSRKHCSIWGKCWTTMCCNESVRFLIYSKIRRIITSVDDMIQIMIVGNQLYSSLSLLARQSMLMLAELPGMVIVFGRFFQLELKVTLATCMVMPELRGITTVYATGYSIWDMYGNSHSEVTCVLLEIPSMHKLV